MKNQNSAITVNPYLEVLMATIIMGSSGVFIKFLALPSVVISCFRMLIPTILLTVYFLSRSRQLNDRPVKWMLLGSLLNAIRIYFFMNSFAYTGIANAVIILYSWPVFVTIFEVLFLKTKVPLRNAVLLLLPIAGIAIIFSEKPFSMENDDFIGMSSMLISAIIYSLSVIIFKKESPHYSGYETVLFQNLVGGFLFLPFLWTTDFSLPVEKLALLLVFGSLLGVLAFGLFFSALKKINAASVSMMSYLEVIFATTYGVLLFNEQLSWNFIIGGSMIILATILLKRS